MADVLATSTPAGPAAASARSPLAVMSRPPEWVWAAGVAIQVAIAASLTSYTYFFYDDFLFLRQAQTQAFSLSYLREGLFEHFSPVTRLLDKLVVGVGPAGFGFAHAVQLVLYAAALAGFALVVRQILGRSWTALALLVLFGQSVFLMRLLNWWTATANILPATVFMLLSLAAYLRWVARRSDWWLIAALVSFGLALLDYETAMIFPANLLLIRLLVMQDSWRPADWMRTIWAEKRFWFGLLALEALALFNYYHQYYFKEPQPTVGQAFHYLVNTLFAGFIPALLGYKPFSGLPSAGTLILTNAIFIGLIGVTLWLRPRAWRCLLAAFIVFLIEMLPLGLNRIKLFGINVGAEPYYEQSLQFMFLVLSAFALSRRWGGERVSPRRPIPASASRAIIAVGAVVYALVYVTSVHTMANASPLPRQAKEYVENLQASISRFKSRTHTDPNLIDLTVPANIMPTSFAPFGRYDQLFSVTRSSVQFDHWINPTFVVDAVGHLAPIGFTPVAVGDLRSAQVGPLTGGVLRRAPLNGRKVCVPGPGAAFLRVPIPGSKISAKNGQLVVGLRYTMPARQNVPVLLANAGGVASADSDVHLWGPGAGAGLALIATPVSVTQVLLGLPVGACVSRLAILSFAPA